MTQSFSTELLHRVEEAGLNASAPPQQRLVDGWLVRFSPGKAKRARCVNAVAGGVLPLERKLELCARVYADAGLPMLLRMTPFTAPPDLSRRLEALGMRSLDDTRVMVSTRPIPAPAALAADLQLVPVGHEAFAQAVGALRGSPLSQRQAHAERLMNSPVPFYGSLLKRDGDIVACAQYAIEDELVGLYDVFTAHSARGQGLATLLCSHVLADAMRRGAKVAYLQVEGDNAAARSVYQRMGFADAYAYHYRTPDPGAA